MNDLPKDTFKKPFDILNSGNGENIIDRPNLDINMDNHMDNHILNEPFTEIEVKKAIKTNEFIKNSTDINRTNC